MKKQENIKQDEGKYPSQQPPERQIIPEKGEEYLREVANIEDTPSPAEDDEAQRITDSTDFTDKNQHRENQQKNP